eukprot:COSAG02_NODE_1197_length_13932_cov_42.811176_15_plen_30_part_01
MQTYSSTYDDTLNSGWMGEYNIDSKGAGAE